MAQRRAVARGRRTGQSGDRSAAGRRRPGARHGERATPKRGPGPAATMGRPGRASWAACPPRRRWTSRARAGACSRMLSPYRLLMILALALAIGSVTLAVLGPRLLGEAINVIFDWLRAPRPRRLQPRRADPGHRGRAERRQRRVRAVPGPADGDDGAAGGVQAARAGAGQAVPAAAELLRPAAARRDPQPRHQRHRQPAAVRAADPEPAGHLAADDRRRAHADVRRLLGAGPDRAGHRSGLGRADAQDRQAGAAAVHQPVEVHRQAERPHRGDVHRARAGHRVRPAGGGHCRPSPSRTRRCTTPATGPSSSPARSSR